MPTYRLTQVRWYEADVPAYCPRCWHRPPSTFHVTSLNEEGAEVGCAVRYEREVADRLAETMRRANPGWTVLVETFGERWERLRRSGR